MIKLGDVISLDKTIKVDIQDDVEYTIAGVQSYGKGVLNKRKELGINMTMKQYQLIEPNQLMWCKVDTKNGAFGITKSEHKGSLASTNMCLAKIKTDKILPEFLEKLFRIKFFHENISHLSSGTTNRKYLTPNQLCNLIYIPNFTIQEQKDFLNFVNKLERSPIFSHIDYQLTLLDSLNQAILQEAVQGKLVPQDPNDEPASELLQRIKLNRAGFQTDPNENRNDPNPNEKKIGQKPTQSGLNRTGFKPRPLKEFPPIKPEEIPFEIPENWVWCRLGEICDNITKGSSPNWQGIQYVSENEGILFITSKNVDSFKIDLTNATYVEEKFNKIEPRSILKKGDILTNIVGASIGRTALFNLDIVANINQAVCIIRIEHSLINKDYLLNLLNSNLAIKLMTNSSFAPGRANLSMGNISNFPIPLPPLSEQKRIVAEIEKQFDKTKQLKEHILANQAATEQLLKALLHQAFEVKET